MPLVSNDIFLKVPADFLFHERYLCGLTTFIFDACAMRPRLNDMTH